VQVSIERCALEDHVAIPIAWKAVVLTTELPVRGKTNYVPASDLQGLSEEDLGGLRPTRPAGHGRCAESAAVFVHRCR